MDEAVMQAVKIWELEKMSERMVVGDSLSGIFVMYASKPNIDITIAMIKSEYGKSIIKIRFQKVISWFMC